MSDCIGAVRKSQTEDKACKRLAFVVNPASQIVCCYPCNRLQSIYEFEMCSWFQ